MDDLHLTDDIIEIITVLLLLLVVLKWAKY